MFFSFFSFRIMYLYLFQWEDFLHYFRWCCHCCIQSDCPRDWSPPTFLLWRSLVVVVLDSISPFTLNRCWFAIEDELFNVFASSNFYLIVCMYGYFSRYCLHLGLFTFRVVWFLFPYTLGENEVQVADSSSSSSSNKIAHNLIICVYQYSIRGTSYLIISTWRKSLMGRGFGARVDDSSYKCLCKMGIKLWCFQRESVARV